MAWLPVANILHYKLRSVLSSLGIGIGICMLVTLSGLSRGSLFEVADRWEAVDADLIVYPFGMGEAVTTLTGIGVSDKYVDRILADANVAERAVPVFLWQVKLGGQDQLAAGVDADRWHTLVGGRKLKEGRLFDPEGRFARWLEKELTSSDGDGGTTQPAEIDLRAAPSSGLEIVIDARLARTGRYTVEQVVSFANHDWTIVGIVPEGGMTRVYMPRRTAQYLFGSGSIQQSTLIFVKLKPGVDHNAAAARLKGRIKQEVVQLSQYRAMLQRKFGVLFMYVDIVNAVALTISFLFTMITLYTMVLQRTREIAILKSSGASDRFILRQVLAESGLLTAAGTVVGIGLSFPAAWAIQTFKPLLTVTITWQWILIAACAAAVGALLSGLYPAWRATRVDMVEALTLE